jgi:hypothetical protein
MNIRRTVALTLTIALTECSAPPGSLPPASSPGRALSPPPGTVTLVPAVGRTAPPAWLPCGVYAIPISNDSAVELIAHGIVWLAYRPELPPGEVESLRGLVHGRKYVLLSPGPAEAQLSHPIVATAQQRQYKAESAGDPGLRGFLQQYATSPEPPAGGGPCTNQPDTGPS